MTLNKVLKYYFKRDINLYKLKVSLYKLNNVDLYNNNKIIFYIIYRYI